MYWFRRPPYLRWTVATFVVSMALWMDLRPIPTESRPFALTGIEAGTRVDESVVQYREVPTGILPYVALDRFAAMPIAPGEPITPALLTDRLTPPEDWWAIEMEIPAEVGAGAELRLVIQGDVPDVMAGLVTAVLSSEPQMGTSSQTAMVAIPADQAASLATALAQGRLSVLIAEW